MIVLGLTGGIASGKSTAARMLRQLGACVFDADAEVHKLLAKNGAAVEKVAKAFNGVKAKDGSIDRKKLGQIVFADEQKVPTLPGRRLAGCS